MIREYWQINVEELSKKILEASKLSNTEEDLKMKVEPLLQNVFKKMGVDISNVQYEKTSTNFRGRSDAVYGYLTIEYKLPGKLSQKNEIKKVIQQIQQYLSEQSSQFGQQKEDFLEKAVGVALDGENILFVRFTKGLTMLQTPIPIELPQIELFPYVKTGQGFQVLGPYPVNKSSISNLLIYIRASAKKPLTAEKLASVFSPNCSITQRTVSLLYSVLVSAQRRQTPSRIKVFYDEWNRIFGIVYGQELEKAEKTVEKTAQLYNISIGARLQQLLFSIQTFYAFLMKLIAIELVSLQRGSTIESFVADLSSLDDTQLKERLSQLESGSDFIHQGIENFLEADFFSWYLDGWEPKLANVFRDIIRALSEFEPATPVLEPEWTKDLLQNLYEAIVPQELRHDLGEYYTPDWLAGYVTDKSGYTGKIGERFLDPACGSGTFLIQAIDRVKKYYEKQKNVDVKEVATHILNNVVGFDINPLAVLTARTNYIIAFSKFISYVRPITIPVYLCDSVLAPTKYEEEEGELQLDNTVTFRTTKCDYRFPVSVQSKEPIDRFTSKVDIALRSKLIPVNFEKQLKNEFDLPDNDIKLLSEIYKQIKTLDDNGENGIWAKYIKNAFAPCFLGKFNFVIGNPPWIRWDFLSDDYRKSTLKLWQKYGLFSLKGYEAGLGGGKKDFSMLFSYACADNYLKDNGVLGFVITIDVFKSKGRGEGFRQFELKNTKTPLKILSMEHMVDIQPFVTAKNRNKTSIFFLKKGEKTTYPVPIIEWRKKQGIGKTTPDWSLEKVLENSELKNLEATPVDPKKLTSSWQTGSTSNHKLFDKIKGKNSYKARAGVNADPYGIFWLEIKEVRPDGIIVVKNMNERGDIKVKSVTTAIESDLIFPAVSGRDITKFGTKSYFYMLVPQEPKTRKPYPENWMLENTPMTFAYLKQFEKVLLSRGSKRVVELAKKTEPYAIFGVGEYTFAKYRVTWKRLTDKLSAVVLSKINTDFGTKPIISTVLTSFIPVDNKEEAHYLCALLNSELVNKFIKSFSLRGGGFGTPSVMENLAIPKFDENNKTHKKLAELSKSAHNLVKRKSDILDIEPQINEEVNNLWNIKS